MTLDHTLIASKLHKGIDAFFFIFNVLLEKKGPVKYPKHELNIDI